MRDIVVKICGITSIDDALTCCAAGARMIGLNFAMGPRKISVKNAAAIAQAVSNAASVVGVFVDEDPSVVQHTADCCGLDYVQLHGSENEQYIKQLANLRVIKAVRPRMETGVDPSGSLDRYSRTELREFLDDVLNVASLESVKYVLVDAYSPGQPGGTGLTANWHAASALKAAMEAAGLRSLGNAFTGLAIAGGLGPANVGECIDAIGPDMVDLNSRVESAPGKKDHYKVALAIAEVQRAHRDHRERVDAVEL